MTENFIYLGKEFLKFMSLIIKTALLFLLTTSFAWERQKINSWNFVNKKNAGLTISHLSIIAGNPEDTIKNISTSKVLYKNNCVTTTTEIHPSICPGTSYAMPDGSFISTTGDYTFNLKDVNGCDSIVKIFLTVSPALIVSLGPDRSVCSGQSVNLGGIVPGAQSYIWNNGMAQMQITVSEPGWYWLEVENNGGCRTRDSVYVSNPLSNFSIGPDQRLCQGDSLTLFGSAVGLYNWNTGSHNPQLVVKTGGLFWAELTASGCTARDSVDVTLSSMPSVTAESSNDIDCGATSAQLTAKGGARYEWSPVAGLSNAYISNPVVNIATSQTYVVKGTDLNGCSGFDTVNIAVTSGGNTNFQMPNAFTPNGDGKNDCFGIKNPAGIVIDNFSIYNRLGQRVFNTKNASDCWNGTFNGKMQEPGGYVFIVKLKARCGAVDKKGTLVLIR